MMRSTSRIKRITPNSRMLPSVKLFLVAALLDVGVVEL